MEFNTPRVAAGVIFINKDRVLMVTPSYKDYCDVPGGFLEPGESPSVAAVREAQEELGISIELGPLLVADWWNESLEAPSAKMLFLFSGELSPRLEKAITVDGDEIVGWSWCPLGQVDQVTIPRLAGRIRHAIDAIGGGMPVYLENGELVDSSGTATL